MQDQERRSDESIRDEIRTSLSQRQGLDASEVEVEVEGGEVTLTGSVEDRDARWLAEDLVESVPGVSLVHNRLRATDG
jgi:osmotically-inducible protein OsmY